MTETCVNCEHARRKLNPNDYCRECVAEIRDAVQHQIEKDVYGMNTVKVVIKPHVLEELKDLCLESCSPPEQYVAEIIEAFVVGRRPKKE